LVFPHSSVAVKTIVAEQLKVVAPRATVRAASPQTSVAIELASHVANWVCVPVSSQTNVKSSGAVIVGRVVSTMLSAAEQLALPQESLAVQVTWAVPASPHGFDRSLKLSVSVRLLQTL
jgi:hypothetical protein